MWITSFSARASTKRDCSIGFEPFPGQDDVHGLRLLLRGEDLEHGVLVQFSVPAQLLHPLYLGHGGRRLFAVDGLHKQFLFVFGEIRDLIGGGEGDFLLVHHPQERGNEIVQLDGVSDRIAADAALRPDQVVAPELRRIVRRSEVRALPLPFDRFQTELVRFCPFAREDFFPLRVGVHHLNDGFVVVQLPDDAGHFVKPGEFAGVFAAVSGDDFISAVSGPDNRRGEDAAALDALGEDPHGLVVSDGVGGKRRGTEIFQGNPGDGFG